MKKLATFLVFGAVLAVGLLGQAMAADVVTVQCSIFIGAAQKVDGSQASAGVTIPPSCAVNSPCSQCVADLLSSGFKLANSFGIVDTGSGGAVVSAPYFVFKTGGGDRDDRFN